MKLNLMQRFTALSIGATLVVGVGLSWIVSRVVTEDLLEDEARLTAEAMRIVTSIDLPPARFEETVEASDPELFRYIWQHADALPGVFRMKVYDADGRIVWSDEEELIGKRYEDNEELDEALAGSVIVEMGKLKEEHEYEAEEFPEDELLEIYVPLRAPGNGSVYGVLEIYKHPQEYFAQKRALVWRVWLAGLGGGILLFLVLHGLFTGALRENLRLQEVERRLAAVRIEMEAAGELQAETMASALPEIPGFRLAAYHQTSREVGGDYYDAFSTPDGSFALIVADSEGKGMPGALVTAEAHEHVHAQASRLTGSADVVAEVNRQLAGRSSPERMVTAFFARLRSQDRRLLYCSAGHCPGLLLRDGSVGELRTGGVPMGLTTTAGYEEESVELQPGDVLLVYTDGVTEAVNETGEQFGAERVKDVLREAGPSGDPDAVVAAVRAAVSLFTGGADPADDTTMLCLVPTGEPTG